MAAAWLEDGVDSLVAAVLSSEPAIVYVTNPSGRTIRGLVELLADDLPETEFRVLAAEATLKAVLDDFVVASMAADLIAADALKLRSLDEHAENSLLVGSDVAIALVAVNDRTVGIATEDRPFIGELRAQYDTSWTEAAPFSLRTPPISQVRHTLARDIGDRVEADFSTMLASLEALDGDARQLDEVTISLLVAAKHDQLLYDISKWGEDVGIASKATFSRTKTDLEEAGLLETEKVPIDVGRPRLRLKLGTPALREADSGDLAGVAVELLS